MASFAVESLAGTRLRCLRVEVGSDKKFKLVGRVAECNSERMGSRFQV